MRISRHSLQTAHPYADEEYDAKDDVAKNAILEEESGAKKIPVQGSQGLVWHAWVIVSSAL